ncbi:MAG: HAD family phosphatase [Bacteroidales bacterium]|nr:HAD family phosphatase [Bacteroidales bacterium]
MLDGIKNIIFDFGGVLYNIRYENVPEAFEKFGVPELKNLYSKTSQTDFINLFEEGKISARQFIDEIHKLSPIPLTDQQIIDAWNAILVGFPKERANLLRALKNNYHLFLFSNTNQLNYDEFYAEMKKNLGYDLFSEMFDGAYFSQNLHIRKPHPEGFKYIIDKHHLNPSETLFIDDSPQHIEGAKKCGLKTHHLKDNETVEQLFSFVKY